MITSFLITTLIIFSINLILNLIVIGFNISEGNVPKMSIVNVIVNLIMITWNIIALVSYV